MKLLFTKLGMKHTNEETNSKKTKDFIKLLQVMDKDDFQAIKKKSV